MSRGAATKSGRLLEQARRSYPHARVQFLRPIADRDALTVTALSGRLAALAEALGL